MALPALSCLLVAVTPVPARTSEELMRITGILLQCYPAPGTTNHTNSTAFRANLLPLLGALPSAAAPTGFASLRSGHDLAFVRGLCFGDSTPSECLRCLSTAARNITAGCGASRRAGIWSDGCFLAYADTNGSSPSEDAFRSRVLLSGDAVPADPHANTTSYSAPQKLVALAQRAAANNSSGQARMLGTAEASATTVASYHTTVESTVRVLAQCARDRTAAD